MATLSHYPEGKAAPAFTMMSIGSIIAAFLSFQFGALLGLVMAVAAILLGAVGALMAILPGKRGGVLSLVAIGAGVIGIIAAVFKLLGGNFL